jgi:hypothetical protein
MIKSFCIGAFVGFLFGSSKMGADTRGHLNGLFNELLKSDRLAEPEGKNGAGEASEYSKFEHKAGNGAREKVGRGESASAIADVPERPLKSKKTESAKAVGDAAERTAKPRSAESAKAIPDVVGRPVKCENNENASASEVCEEAPEAKDDATKSGEEGLSSNKAHELADKLSAKPSPPPHEELEPS